MIIIGVDVETTGLEGDEHQIVEMGVVLYCTDTERVLSSFGKIYKVDEWGEEAAKCHQIPRETSNLMPHIDEDVSDPWDVISGDLAKYIIAHNAPHDYPKVTKRWPKFTRRPWLCSQRDLAHSDLLTRRVSSYRLGHLAVDYGIILMDWHQAVADAKLCAMIASKHDLDSAYKHKLEPKYKLICNGSFINNIKESLRESPSVIKSGGYYRWDGDTKSWYKEGLTSADVEKDAAYIKKITNGRWKFDLEELPNPSY